MDISPRKRTVYRIASLADAGTGLTFAIDETFPAQGFSGHPSSKNGTDDLNIYLLYLIVDYYSLIISEIVVILKMRQVVNP